MVLCFVEILKPREFTELSLIFPTLEVIIGYLRENTCKAIQLPINCLIIFYSSSLFLFLIYFSPLVLFN